MTIHIPRFTPEEIGDHQRRIQNIVIEHKDLIDVEDELRRRVLAGGGRPLCQAHHVRRPVGLGKEHDGPAG